MNSPFDDPAITMLSTSPSSIRDVSPTRRRADRDPPSPTDSVERNMRARGSPTLTRSMDPNDPDARERQRTMDVGMALHLSRARRETIALPSPSPFDAAQTDAEPPWLVERNCILSTTDVIRGPPHVAAPGTATPLGLGVDDMQSPSSFDTMQGRYSLPSRPDQASSMSGLPRYQSGGPQSGPVFDFGPLENFAAEEKESLGLTLPSSPLVMKPRFPRQSMDVLQSHAASTADEWGL
ncbi:hypothetical protein JVU11DRAFT_2011 [Chiua virens]|nr:hypothetical protein JVU11DRAFT_2011 [Chiua virens]